MSTSLRYYVRGYDQISLRERFPGNSRYYHYDHQGTTECLTDRNGVVTDRFTSDAWGVPAKRTGNSINRYWYIGQSSYYSHVNQAVDYVRARYLMLNSGTWLCVDPLSLLLTTLVGESSYHDQKSWDFVRTRILRSGEARPVVRDRPKTDHRALPIFAEAVNPLDEPEAKYAYAHSNPVRLIDSDGLRPHPVHSNCSGPLCKLSGDPCGWAKIWGLDKGHLGGVFCCDGKKYVCNWSDGRVPAFQIGCILKHEQSHADDPNARCQWWNGRLGFSDDASQNRGECFAHWEEIRCLLAELKKCGPRGKGRICRAPIITAITGACGEAESYCQGAGIVMPRICDNPLTLY